MPERQNAKNGRTAGEQPAAARSSALNAARPGVLITARPPALVAAATGALVVVVLAVVVWHGTTTSFDTWAIHRAALDFPPPGSLGRRFWLWFSEPVLSIAVPTVVAVCAAVMRRWNVAALAVVGPLLALVLTELVGKPLIGRVIGPGVLQGSMYAAVTGSYPSGHETALVSWLVLLLVLLFRAPAKRLVRAVGLTVAIAWTLAGALGLTVNYYHYATDTIGAMGLATATVLIVALVIDRWLPVSTTSTGQREPTRQWEPTGQSESMGQRERPDDRLS